MAIAAWRRLLLDREAGIVRSPTEHAMMFPGAESFLVTELTSGSASTLDPVAGSEVGPYRLVRQLGRGAQATVWLASRRDGDGRQVALKVFRLTGSGSVAMALRLRNEIAAAARIDTKGACEVFDTGADGAHAWIAMRYVDGPTLAQVLAAEPGSPSSQRLRQRLGWLESVARTVHAVHQAGIVHRDLKPSNVLLERNGAPVVVDFGVAKALEADAQLTATGVAVGTPAYMSPEQVANSAAVGPATDVFALGSMLFECAVGQRPFDGATPFALQRAVIEQPHGSGLRGWRNSLPRDLVIVLDTALAKSPGHRYRNANEFADDLARLQRQETVRARAIGPLRLLIRTARRRPAIAALVLVLTVTILTALAVALTLLADRDRQLRRADREHEFVLHLSDRSRLRQLQRELDDELAIDSAQLPRFVDWWSRATEVIERLPLHEAFHARLREAGSPWPETDERARERRLEQQQALDYARARERQYRQLAEAAAARGETPPDGIDYALETAASLLRRAEANLADPAGMDFPTDNDRFMFGEVDALLAELRQFSLLRPGSFTRKAGHWLWQKAEKIRAASIDARAAEWRAAIARIADPEGAYRGLAIEPQEGLVPLGPDPASGLEEFADVSTGSIPVRSRAGRRLEYTPDAAMVLVLLPGGTAHIGALEPPAEVTPRGAEVPPPVTVELAPFFIGKHEVTRAQWFEIMYGKPASTHQAAELPNRLPVETVANATAARFARRLCMALPTEAQWEYACRAGTRTGFWFGATAADAPLLVALRPELVDDRESTAPPRLPTGPREVGGDPANGFGLHDMHGNVAEWTRESNSSYSLPFLPGDGARVPSAIRGITVRGGSYKEPPYAAQSWWRGMEPPFHELPYVGVRLVRPVR